MDIIKEFLNNSNMTNSNVIMTAVISTIITTALISVGKTFFKYFKLLCSKMWNWIKNNKFRLMFEIHRFFYDRKYFKKFYEKYKRYEIKYDWTVDADLKSLKYLSKKQKKIREEIMSDNEEIVKEGYKKIVEKLEDVVRLEQNRILPMPYNKYKG